MFQCVATWSVIFVAALTLCGCANDAASDEQPTDSPPQTEKSTGGHNHGSLGPHKGDLIELGGSDYHAELVHSARSVTVYMLDGAAKKLLPIDAEQITINVMHDGKPEQFSLAAAPRDDDPAGRSSRFQIDDSHVTKHLGDATLVVQIDGKQFRGQISHSHSH